MHKLFFLLLCISLAGVLLLTGCTRSNGETQVAGIASPTSISEESPDFPTPTLMATSTRVVKPTQTPVKPTRTARPTVTPTVTGTLNAVDAAEEIDQLLKNLVTDLENTETILETEIP